MKNNIIKISMIILLTIIAICLIAFMKNVINNQNGFRGFFKSYKTSEELVINENYDNNFDKISIESKASNIYVYSTEENEIRIKYYGVKDEASISTENNTLKISTFENNKFFNTKISKTEIYVPKTYDKLIEIKNNYGNVEVGEFKNSTISIEEDYGNVKVENAKDITIQNNYGDISLGDAESATLNESCGDIKVKKVDKVIVENKYGDIVIDNVEYSLQIEDNCGDVEIKNINLKENSYIKNNLGDIKILNTNEIYFDAKTNLGDTKINNNYNKSEITLKIQNDCGDIEINN